MTHHPIWRSLPGSHAPPGIRVPRRDRSSPHPVGRRGTGKSVYPRLFDAFTTLGHGSAPTGGCFGGPGSGGAQDDPPHSWGPEDRPGTSTWLTAADDIDGGDDRFEEWRGAGFTTVLSTLHAGLVPGQAAVYPTRPRRRR